MRKSIETLFIEFVATKIFFALITIEYFMILGRLYDKSFFTGDWIEIFKARIEIEKGLIL